MVHTPDRWALERNVRLYPLYQAFLNCYFWLPVFFLYFNRHMTVGDVLRLEAIYYATVVVLEVPSGYFSDRFGRRRTLLVAAAALGAAYALFFFGEGFAVFVAAQMLLAAGLAFNSGTDTAFHYDSLAALGRQDEYAAREARVNRIELAARAVAALVGGVAGSWQLGLPYGLALIAAAGMLGTVLLFREPGAAAASGSPRGFRGQLAACLRHLRTGTLGWLFAFAVLMTVINHVPYELYQPYIDLLVQRRELRLPGEGTPLLTGALTAAMMLVAAWAAGRSVALRNRIGLTATLLLTTLLQVAVMAAMGLFLHEVVLLLVLLRSVPAAMLQAPLRAAIMPRLEQSLRATYFSLQSLAGRLSFAVVLWGLSMATPGEAADWQAISTMSLFCAGAGLVGFLLLALAARPCLQRP